MVKIKNTGYYPVVGENMNFEELLEDYGDFEVVPDFKDLTEEDVVRMRMSQDVAVSLEEEKLDSEGNTQFKPWISKSEFNGLVEDLSGNGILSVFNSGHSDEVIAAIEGLLTSDSEYLDYKILNLPYRYGENGKRRWDTIYRADVPEKGKVISASKLDNDRVLALASEKDAYGNGILNPRFTRKSIREQLLAAQMDIYDMIWFVIHPNWFKLLNLSQAAYRKPNIDLTEWTTTHDVKDEQGFTHSSYKLDLGFGCSIEIPYAIPTPIRDVFSEFYLEQRVLRAGNRKRKVQRPVKGESEEEKVARLEKFAKVNGIMVSIPNGCLIPELSGLKDSEGNPERFMAPLVLFGIRNDSESIKELEKFLKFRIEEINKKSGEKVYLNPAIGSLSRGASICGSFGLPLPVWDKRGRKGKEYPGEVFSPVVKGSDWTGEPSKFLIRHYAAVLNGIDQLDDSMSLKEARFAFNREVAIFKHKCNCLWNEEDPEARKKAGELRTQVKTLKETLMTLKRAAINSDSPNRRAGFIKRFNEVNAQLKEVNKELRRFATLKPAEKAFIRAKLEEGRREVETKFPVFDSEDDNDEEDSENFNYSQYYWNLENGSATVEGVDFGAKRSELATTDSWGYWIEEAEFLEAEELQIGQHPTVKTIRRQSVDTIHKTLSSSSSNQVNKGAKTPKGINPSHKPSIGTGYGVPADKCRMAAAKARHKAEQREIAANKKNKTVWYVPVKNGNKTQWVRKTEDN